MDIKFVTVSEMRHIETIAVKEYGKSIAALMESAGKAVANEAMAMVKEGEVWVFCGYGNNGGDGLVAARYLIKQGYKTKVFLVGSPKPFSTEASLNYTALLVLGCQPQKISTTEEINKSLDDVKDARLLIDAIFGVGIRGTLEKFYITLIDKINSLDVPIISVDIPSGLDADTGKPLGVAIKAIKTLTMGYPKIGFKDAKAKPYLGELVVADIGL